MSGWARDESVTEYEANMKQIIILSIAAMSLSACSTVKMPDFNLGKLAEFKDAKIDGDYPSVADAPEVPTEIRSDAAWDQSAKALIGMRDSFEIPDGDASAKTPAEIAAEFERLRAQTQAYKADDPVGGVNN